MKSISFGRTPKYSKPGYTNTKAQKISFTPTSIIMAFGTVLCTVFLCFVLSGAPETQMTLDNASAAASAKLASNETVAVFLGLDSHDDFGDSVYVMNNISDDDIFIDAPKENTRWSMWGYISDLIRNMLSPENDNA